MATPQPPDERSEFAPLDFRDQALALRRLRCYRWLCGASADVEISWEYSEAATAAVRLLMLTGKLTHTPSYADGVSDSLWELGSYGCANCNLGREPNLRAIIDSLIYDSDPTNISSVGHRRFCLSPLMKFTAFGAHGGFVAMFATDKSHEGEIPEMIAYPAPGYFPVNYITDGAAWSVHLDPERFGAIDDNALRVVMHKADSEYRVMGDPLVLDHLTTGIRNYGHGAAIIFRPKDVHYRPSARFWVEITGITDRSGAERKIQYLVEFF